MKARWLDNCLMVGMYRYKLCTSQEMFEAELQAMDWPRQNWPCWLNTDHGNACTHAFHGKGIALVCMPPYLQKDALEIVGLIVHEAVHLWQHECDWIGEDSPSREFEAYSIQRIVNVLLWEYRRQVFSGQ